MDTAGRQPAGQLSPLRAERAQRAPGQAGACCTCGARGRYEALLAHALLVLIGMLAWRLAFLPESRAC